MSPTWDDDPSGFLFPTQNELPPLPLPALDDTCERYLDSVRPLLSADEYKHTEAVVADFAREGGDGCALQSVCFLAPCGPHCAGLP